MKLTTYPDLQCMATACAQQWLYLIGDEGVVYSQVQNRFVGLDAAGVAAYQAFDAGVQLDDLQAFDAAGAASYTARKTLNAIFALSRGIFPEDHGRKEGVDWQPLEYPETANIEIQGIPVLFEHPRGLLEELCNDCFRHCPSTTRPARFHLRAQYTRDDWTISANGHEFFSSLQGEQVGLGLLHAVRSLLYTHADYDVAFHAAMVADDYRGIMLCAPRESGKSTLAAHLVAQGFDLVTDEPALLHLDTCSVSSLNMPISLKEGSWEILHPEWPQLAGAPIHVRSDTTRIKLLHPRRERLPDASRRLTHILFPTYSPSSLAYVERLPLVSTLTLLNRGGMLLKKRLDNNIEDKDKGKRTFELLLHLISQTPAYMVRYNSLPDADKMIRSAME